MRTTDRIGRKAVAHRRMSRLRNHVKDTQTLRFLPIRLGSSDPRHYPHPTRTPFPLGGPIDIEDVALILGCSPWTVRQKYLPQGLPHLRASAAGKLVFFRDQIVGWILERQEKQTKGGIA